MYTVRRLGQSEHESAERFLYETYYLKQNWSPRVGNPSDWRVEVSGGREVYRDKYSDVSVWHAVYHDGSLVGIIRRAPAVESRLDFQNYHADEVVASKSVELNRLAIASGYPTQEVTELLLDSVLNEFGDDRPSIYIAAFSDSLRDQAATRGFRFLCRFKYHESDPNVVSLMVLEGNAEGHR